MFASPIKMATQVLLYKDQKRSLEAKLPVAMEAAEASSLDQLVQSQLVNLALHVSIVQRMSQGSHGKSHQVEHVVAAL